MADQTQSSIDAIKRFTVGIMRSANDDLALGTGVIVTDDGLILTCYHVISDIYKKIISNAFYVSFPAQLGIRLPVQVVAELCNSSQDIAFLQLQGELPKQVAIANLSETIDSKHTFQSFGFRKQTAFDGLYADGIIQGKVHKKFKEDDRISLKEVIQLKSDDIDHGMSGAAVLDTAINRVIGIVSEHLATSSNVDKNFALAIPIESVIEIYPELKQKNPGLRILEFLRRIGEETWRYEKIDELYVQPANYNEIKEVLYKDRILFITGTQEYGKTYTAVHLLWEYFNNGYEPVWFKGGERREERSDVRSRFTNVEKYLKPKHIIYFEDPFGKIQYEVAIDEGIVRNIASVIEIIENGVDDTYVIITSGEEVFKEFERKITAEINLSKFEKKLTIKAPSYNYKKRKELLLKYAEVKNCKWREDKDLSNTVFETIKDESKLPTPLNIKDFVIASVNIKDEQKLLKILDAKSIETARSFAQEINGMNNFNILFLSFPFIDDSFKVDFVKNKYQELINDRELIRKFKVEKEDAPKFDKILKWFKDDKIDIVYDDDEMVRDIVIRFSHPSYFEAFRFALSSNSDSSITQVGKILGYVLLNLADNIITSSIVAYIVTSNFDKLPEDVQNLLFKLADKKKEAFFVAHAVARNYDKLPENVQSLLFKLADNKETAYCVADAVSFYFDKLPENVQSLLFKLADNKETAKGVSHPISYHFDKISKNVRSELLRKLAENRDVALLVDVAYSVASNFDKLPEDAQSLLFKLADNKETAKGVADAVSHNFNKLPENVRNELLLKLADDKETARVVVYTLDYNFNKLPENVRNELLLKLADKKYEASSVADIVSRNFDKLPENARKEVVLKLADRDYSAGYLANSVANNFDKLPENARNELLVKLSYTSYGAIAIANVISSNFNKLPENVQNLLLKLADNKDAAFDVADAVASNFDNLPEKVQNLLFKIADDKDAARDVAWAVAFHFNKLPENVRNDLLLKLADNKKAARRVADIVSKNFDKLPENTRNELHKRLKEHGYVIYG